LFLIYIACYIVYNNMYFVIQYLQNLKCYLKSLLQRTVPAGSCFLLCMFAIYVFTVSICVGVRSGVEILRGPCVIIKYKPCYCVDNRTGSSQDLHTTKGKAVPLQAWSSPEGSRKLKFPYFLTTAQGGGKIVGLTHRPPLPPGNTPGTHFC
jgi:hypothetical protein